MVISWDLIGFDCDLMRGNDDLTVVYWGLLGSVMEFNGI
jgi:hypothetical protein